MEKRQLMELVAQALARLDKTSSTINLMSYDAARRTLFTIKKQTCASVLLVKYQQAMESALFARHEKFHLLTTTLSAAAKKTHTLTSQLVRVDATLTEIL